MMEIKGMYATAVVYANIIEDIAVKQIQRMCDTPFTEGCTVRVMPDVHAGKGCTIGTTMTLNGRAVPNVVGVDIGCGMYAVRLDAREIDFAAVDAAAHRVPSGRDVWDEPLEEFDLTGLACAGRLRHPARLACSLGTLGGGNHFIEIDRAEDGANWLVIHSGSRNLGRQVAEFYQQMAVDLMDGKAKWTTDRNALIAEMKAAGRQREIQDALRALERATRTRDVPDDLCWLEGKPFEDYLHDVEICQRFAARNRELIAGCILADTGMRATDAFHTVHNYIDTDGMILRKGAISARAGERVLIPVNMRDGSILAVGKGDPEWNWSAPHGAGRIMSRTAAKHELTLEAYRASMAGVWTTSVSEDTLDEAPMAYKSLADILDVVRGTVDVVEVMKPVYNFKASE